MCFYDVPCRDPSLCTDAGEEEGGYTCAVDANNTLIAFHEGFTRVSLRSSMCQGCLRPCFLASVVSSAVLLAVARSLLVPSRLPDTARCLPFRCPV